MNLPNSVIPKTSLSLVLQDLLTEWPEHEAFLQKSFTSRSPEEWEDSYLLADLILKISNGAPNPLVASYRELCRRLLVEELEFQRSGAYRHQTMADANRSIYQNNAEMQRYIEGLLLSQLLWNNHVRAFSYLKRVFLPQSPTEFHHLEIGPGHGLLSYLAANSDGCREVTGWDISPASLELTALGLKSWGIAEKVQLSLRDVTKNSATERHFDNIVLSEVLEHVEDPKTLLETCDSLLRPHGRLFINVPINSPAPDHIYLLRSPEEAKTLVEASGYQVLSSEYFPMTGLSLEQARRRNATISCVFIAKRASA